MYDINLLFVFPDLQYSIAVGDLNSAKHNQNGNQNNPLLVKKILPSCDKNYRLSPEADNNNARVIELEQLLKLQSLQHQKEIQEKKSKILALEESIITSKNINKLQNTCKNLYQDGDNIVLNRIDDISSRAARRDVGHHER